MTPVTLDDAREVDASCNWDEEQIEEAIHQAHSIERFDPEAAKQLLAQAQAAKQKRQGSTDLRASYDPMALYARVLRFYQGGITDNDLKYMDYRRFLGYVREATLISEEERRATQTPQHTTNTQALLNDLPHAQAYEGEVVRLI